MVALRMCDTIPFNLPKQSMDELHTAMGNARGSDNTFLNSMLDGYRWELYVLGQLQMYGYWGAIHPLRTRPDRVQAKDYSDPYDILLGSQPGVKIRDSWQLHLDVKARSYQFNTPDTWPFDTVTVDPVSRYEKRDVKPDWWAVVSSRSHGIMFISNEDLLKGEEEFLPGYCSYKSAPKELFISLDAFVERLPAATVSMEKRAKHPAI